MCKRKIVIATGNPDKFKEVKAILSNSSVEILDGCNLTIPEETGSTLEENAILKAKSVYEQTGEISIADDTGLEVLALDNAPGIYSARFAGENATYSDNKKKLLLMLESKPITERKAKFRCVIAAVSHDGIKTFEGTVDGYITNEELGENGFGYDSVFFVQELGKTFAQLTTEEKNNISHRAIALLKAKKYLYRELL